MGVLNEARFRLGSALHAHRLHEEIRTLNCRLEERSSREEAARNDAGLENLVWIFGAGRSGTTWLKNLLGDLDNIYTWEEPYIGRLFGSFARQEARKGRSANHIFSSHHREAYLRGVRSMVLEGMNSRYANKLPNKIVVKEPNGSEGAPLLSAATPESSLILVTRDPRDVMASVLDSAREGSWQQRDLSGGLDNELKARLNKYLINIKGALAAYETHEGPKVQTSYEQLIRYPEAELSRICTAVGITAEDEKVAKTVKARTFSNIPQEKRGTGKFYRKAQPGSWHEDLTLEQSRIVEEGACEVMRQMGYG